MDWRLMIEFESPFRCLHGAYRRCLALGKGAVVYDGGKPPDFNHLGPRVVGSPRVVGFPEPRRREVGRGRGRNFPAT